MRYRDPGHGKRSVDGAVGGDIVHRQGQLHPVAHTEFVENGRQVGLYGALGDLEGRGNLSYNFV